MRSSVRYILVQRTGNDCTKLFLIISTAQSPLFLRIGQEATFDQHPGPLNMLHEINPAAFLFHSPAAGIQMGDKSCLQIFGKSVFVQHMKCAARWD